MSNSVLMRTNGKVGSGTTLAHGSGVPVGLADGTDLKRAALYLRVSTPSQVNTDYNAEGISLPAQREACEAKAAALRAEVVREFVEPGRTATSIDKRPVFQEMMAWIREQKNVDYVIVYHFNRLFRSTIDAALVKRDLRKLGIRVVSTIIDLGEGPEGDMVEAILNAVDEYRSRADGADIAYKMGAKARKGGTIGYVPIGYQNARDRSEGRNIGIVVFDPERADLVRSAFELYATGDYSLQALADELTTRGLRTRRGRLPSGPMSDATLQEMLADPYYIGFVTYKGDLIHGHHEPLVTPELFDRVQKVLEERRGLGVRQRKHVYYLKGLLWCGECHEQGVESRLYMQLANGNGGRYRYWFCGRRAQHQCQSRYLEGDAVEDALTAFYRSLSFPTDMAERLREAIRGAIEEQEKAAKLLHQRLGGELDKLDRQEINLVELAADGSLPTDKVKERLRDIQRRRQLVKAQLEEPGERLNEGAVLLENALLLLEAPGELFERMAPEQRRLLNQALFEKIYIREEHLLAVSKAVFQVPFDDLMAARDIARGTQLAGHTGIREDGQVGTLASIFVNGSKRSELVEVMGFEPTASTMRT